MKFIHKFLFVAAIATVVTPASLPASLKKCNVKSSDFKDCIKNAVQAAVIQLKAPIPELNLTSLEPLHIPSLRIPPGSGVVGVEQLYKDMHVAGFSTLKFDEVDVDFDKKTIFMTARHVSIKIWGLYHMDGRVLLLPIQGDGDFTLDIRDANATLSMKWREYKKQDRTYLKATSCQVKFNPTKMILEFKNLFNGDKVLGDNMNNLLTENWEEVYKDVADSYTQAFCGVFQKMSNAIFSRVPKSEIFEGIE